jgi:hypothetical protein
MAADVRLLMEMLPSEEILKGVLKVVAAVFGVTVQCVVH